MSRDSQLPPPIRDPSGKIYIAIPAPSFVLAQDAPAPSSTISSEPSYIYVEYTSNSPHELPESFAAYISTELEGDASVCVKDWMTKSCSAEPPPGHIPWIGEVLPSSSSGSITTSAGETTETTLRDALPSLSLTSSSVSTIEIPSIDSSNILLNGSLPSTCSSGWSRGIVPPPMGEAKAATRVRKNKPSLTSASRKSIASVKHLKAPDQRRYTVCVTPMSKRREALIFNRRRTVEKSQKIRPQTLSIINQSTLKSKIMTKIDELDDFFSEGLKTMDLTMRRLDEEQSRVEPPSLVVSTSSAITPVSLDSCGELGTMMPSLARRRGKASPGTLKLDDHAGLARSTIEYPDLPTAFRVSLESISDEDYEIPKYPLMSVSPRMTAEQMISSLREQVKGLGPSRRKMEKGPEVFSTQCKEAETWLEIELECSPRKSRLPNKGSKLHRKQAHKQTINGTATSSCDDIPLLSHLFPLPPSDMKQSSRSKLPQIAQSSPPERVQHLNMRLFGLRAGSCGDQNSVTLSPAAKPRKSILSNGSVSSSGSAKKVRFSDGEPLIIPPLKNISIDVPISSNPTKRIPVASPKRKPVPSLSSVKSPESSQLSLPPTPMKSSATRRSSPLNPAAQLQISTPRTQLAFKRTAARSQSFSTPVIGMIPKRRPLVFSSVNVPNPKENVDESKMFARPLSLGDLKEKENRERSFSDKLATLTKRRSYSAGTGNVDKENQRDSKLAELVAREIQKKGGKRSLPFQNMLSRLRG